jgi:hypothetical protein
MGIFRVPRKKISSRPPQTTSDIIRGKEQEIRLKKRDIEVKVSFSGRSILRALDKRRGLLLGLLSILILVFGINRLTHTYASIAELSPSSCLGGWENPTNATGNPDASSEDPNTFTAGNSAVLRSGSASELYCGSFEGNIPEETVPKALNLHLSWTFKEPSEQPVILSTSTLIIEEASSTPTSTEAEPAVLIEEAPAPLPELDVQVPILLPEPAPQESSEPAAWILKAFAADEEPVPAEAEATTTELVVIDPTADDLLEITYTLDGTTWQSLGRVDRNNWQALDLVIRNDTITDWETVKKIQIGIRSLSTTGEAPTIYMDAMTLSVEYEEVTKEAIATSTDPNATSTLEVATSTEATSTIGYSRMPQGNLISSPITVNFNFENWDRDMDFVDIFGERQNYWWIQVDAENDWISSECYPSSTMNGTATFHLPPGDYYAVSINSASTLENCKIMYGGRTPFEKQAFGEAGDGGNTKIFTVK